MEISLNPDLSVVLDYTPLTNPKLFLKQVGFTLLFIASILLLGAVLAFILLLASIPVGFFIAYCFTRLMFNQLF